MPGPFPGMDPYLERHEEWLDVHNSLAGEIRTALNQVLPPPYYAQVERRAVSGEAFIGENPRRPDSSVIEGPWPNPAGGAVGLLPGARTEATNAVDVSAASADPAEQALVEVRDGRGSSGLVTAIEILSFANKGGGRDRRTYVRKQRDYADGGVSLVEIDPLRTGRRSPPALRAQRLLERRGRRFDYLVLVRRSSGDDRTFAQPFALTQPFPATAVPLRRGTEDVVLDLQYCFDRQYDGGPFRRSVNYDAPPDPPLPPPLRPWAAERIAAWREGREPGISPPAGDGEPGDGAGEEA